MSSWRVCLEATGESQVQRKPLCSFAVFHVPRAQSNHSNKAAYFGVPVVTSCCLILGSPILLVFNDYRPSQHFKASKEAEGVF